ncbi:hypothetical protein [Nocardia carnea]|uniref:hypothetical protein n=1 Tax=Nocardia carnea TaxID=37328 RepID=UPI002458BA5B|nr:hypothetical protein [Nocardia carnea]
MRSRRTDGRPGVEPPRITAEEFLNAEPDALSGTFGDVEVVDGLVVRCQFLSGKTNLSDEQLGRLLSCMGFRLEVVR